MTSDNHHHRSRFTERLGIDSTQNCSSDLNLFRPSTIVLRNSIPNASSNAQPTSEINTSPEKSNYKLERKRPEMDSVDLVSPIDLATQEKIKLERKRQRNRVAASKCRKKKLAKISLLHDRVVFLRKDNTDLAGIRDQLRHNVAELKEHLRKHLHYGCNINIELNTPNEKPNSYMLNNFNPALIHSNLFYGKR